MIVTVKIQYTLGEVSSRLITTFRRVDNQITFNNLPDDVENVILVVQNKKRPIQI